MPHRTSFMFVVIACLLLLMGCVPSGVEMLDPVHEVQAHIDKGFDYQVAGQFEQAVAEYTAALELAPYRVQAANALALRASAYTLLNDYEHALADATESIKLDPTVASSHRGRGYIYLELERWQDALSDFDKAIELDDQEYRAYLGRATAHVHLNHADLALADYRASIALAPDQPNAEVINGAIKGLERMMEQ